VTAKIIVTSPYPQFTSLVKQVSMELEIKVMIIEAVLEDAISLVERELEHGDYEVVVSRGGTAAAIKEHLEIPVVTAEFSDFDLLQALWKATRMGDRVAYLGYPYRAGYEFSDLVDILGVEVKQYLYHNSRELRQQVERAYQDGINVVVGGGAWGQHLANSVGMQGLLIYSSKRSVVQALERAKEIIEIRRKDREHFERINTMLQAVNEGVVCVDADGRILLLNSRAEELLKLNKEAVLGSPVEKTSGMLRKILTVGLGGGQWVTDDGVDLVVDRQQVKNGAENFGDVFTLFKVSHLQQLEQKVRKEIHQKGLVAHFTFEDILTSEKIMKDTIAKARNFARVDSTVLIRGESGSGKELFAQSIHRESPRKEGPFVAVNCAALPENLLESELFGYEEGAFTGARKGGKAGLFEIAHGGTIFLDEIGSISLNLQARLLRVLQAKEVMRIGAERVIPVDIRCIAATNEDLRRAIREERFRQDLYFRLNVLNLNIPALRERRQDIALLARHFVQEYSRYFQKKPMRIPAEVLHWMENYSWPGNVRELENFVERMVILADGEALEEKWVGQLLLEADEGVIQPQEGTITVTLGSLEEMEQQIIASAERIVGGNRSELARLLGVSRTTIWKKLSSED